MRAGLLSLGLFALAFMLPWEDMHRAVDTDRAIPRFILQHDQWVCVDRNPRQLSRRDCWPRLEM